MNLGRVKDYAQLGAMLVGITIWGVTINTNIALSNQKLDNLIEKVEERNTEYKKNFDTLFKATDENSNDILILKVKSGLVIKLQKDSESENQNQTIEEEQSSQKLGLAPILSSTNFYIAQNSSAQKKDYNCNDFSNRNDLMNIFNKNGQDIHGLDRDKDGIPCENLTK